MGKQILYHPVSLNVIRGAAEYGGFKLAKLRQNRSSRDHAEAVYIVEIAAWPATLDQVNTEILKAHLNNCYASDVECTLIWITKSGKRMARLETKASEHQMRLEENAVRYEDLTDEQKADIPF